MLNKIDTSLPFAMQVLANSKVKIAHTQDAPGVLVGVMAMKAAGVQPEFVAANMLQAFEYSIILRAGAGYPQYNKKRGSKSGVNLSKTSNQGFFKGSLSEEIRFARVESNREPKRHNEKDAEHLLLKPTDPDYQHTMQLDINMRDILCEVSQEGDLTVLGFNQATGLLRFEYKEGRGPKKSLFNGQFVVNLNSGENIPIFYSREWDKPEHDKNWDPVNKVIKKPSELAGIPDTVYQKVFNHSFKVGYTENKNPNPESSEIKSANVFANRARSAYEFKQAMGEHHPQYSLIRNCVTVEEVLSTLKDNLSEMQANKVIMDIYNKSGSIITSDWDGMALGHPPGLDPQFKEVINVFAPREESILQKEKLLKLSDAYLNQIKVKAQKKKNQKKPLSAFEEKALSISSFREVVSDFALAQAGCITPHEFVFQQMLNHAYKDRLNTHYGEKYDTQAVQTAMDKMVSVKELSKEEVLPLAKQLLQAELMLSNSHISRVMINKIAKHMVAHFTLAINNPSTNYTLPHVQHDVNVHDLYQHGFDMRNPYGSNLDGPWLLITADGSTMYGKKQEELVEILLTGDFLEKNHINVSHGADLAAGWGRVVGRQIELKQTIPPKTMVKYQEFHKSQQQIHHFQDMKNQFSQLRASVSESTKDPEVQVHSYQEVKPAASMTSAQNFFFHPKAKMDTAMEKTVYYEEKVQPET